MNLFKYTILTTIIGIVSLLCLAAGATGDEASSKGDGKKMKTLFASGDAALARWVHQGYYDHGAAWMIDDIKSLVADADIAMTNLECVVSTTGHFFNKGERRPYLYRGRPELLDILTEAGFDVVTVSNNHGMDYGPEALVEEIELLKAAGIAEIGGGANLAEASTPTYMQIDDIIVAFIGLETMFPRYSASATRPGIFHAKEYAPALKALKKPVAEARRYADLVVFTPHWGDNWTENPTEERRKLARDIIDLGVDAILGHSAHHIHGVEVYKGKPIVYDMGTLLFDNVSQGRLRYSAGFVLDFDKSGFTKLTIHPLELLPNRVTVASGPALEKIQSLLIELSKSLDPETALTVEGDNLVLPLNPTKDIAQGERLTPPEVHVTGQTRTLPEPFRSKKTNVVFDAPPEWTKGFKPVLLDNGVTILGAIHSEAARPRSAFTAEIALKVPGPLTDKAWDATIKAVQQGGGDEFVYRHPIADGAWTPPIWEKGEIGSDRTLVRPPKEKEGTYDLFWRMENVTDGTHAQPVDRTQGTDDGYVPIGQILVTETGIPSGTAGVAWDGKLPTSDKPAAPQDTDEGPPWYFFAVIGALGAIIAIWAVGSFLWRRKTGNKKSDKSA